MLKNGYVADIPLIFAAIDPCICCAERTVTLVDGGNGQEKVVRMSELRKLARERWKKAPLKKDAEWPF
jgi:hypothetical protein